MKNLKLYRHTCEKITDLGNVKCFCVDANSHDLYIVIENSVHRYHNLSKNVKCVLNIAEFISTPDCSGIIGISHNVLPEGNVVCVACRSGDLITFDVDTEDTQCVGFVASGLRAMQWSLDQEILVLVTGMDTIIVMTSTFDPVSEVNFHQDGFGEKQFVNVGWGKKETQFHGSEGKAAARVVKTEVLPSTNPDDSLPRISWREDGKLFAVSLLDSDTKLRCIRIFSREGILQYTGEMISGLEMTLAWRPSGSVIASTQTLPNKYQVVFLEKNGLRHGEFSLPCAPGEGRVHQLAWSAQSDVLAVWFEDHSGSQLQLWTSSNYHWYLKQSLPFPDEQKLLALQWDAEAPLTLHILSRGLHYSVLEWIWGVDHSPTLVEDNKAFVGVIDGCNILVTSFRETVIPPPMCGQTLELPVPVDQVVFGSSGLLAALSDGTVAIFCEEGSRLSLRHIASVAWECDQPAFLPVPNLHHWTWISPDRIMSVYTLGQTSQLVVLHLDNVGNLIARLTLDAGNVVLTMVSWPDARGALVQLQNRSLIHYTLEEDHIQDTMTKLPQSLVHMEVCSLGDMDTVVGLTSNSRLYMQGNEVANNVTSLYVLPDFILLTTSQHRLHCMRLVGPTPPPLTAGRRLERGSRLVVAVDTRVVLQMPRGNLETITPRPLVLRQAARLLDAGQYRSVMDLLRKQRVNMNLLVDHNPTRFLTDARAFVEDVANPSWLSLFLLEINEDDVTATMYSEWYQPRERPQLAPNKVKSVCDAVRSAMQASPDWHSFHLPIIASYIQKRTTDDLAAALLEVKRMSGSKREEALSYMLYMADVNDLFDIALGLYDFQLVEMVAARSNKDPREYRPFLAELQQLEPVYMRYSIDKHLKRYSSALEHIAQCPDHLDECLALVQKHDLYSKAVSLFPRESEGYRRVAAAYADKLMVDRLFSEAAIFYQRSDLLSQALEACLSAADWREALVLMTKMDYSETQQQEVCRRLSSMLVQRRRYLEAAQLLSQYVRDTDSSVDILRQGHHWDEALKVAYLHRREDLVESVVKPAVLEHLEHVVQLVSKSSEQFSSQRARLAVVRTNKQLRMEEGDAHLGDECDLYSDTSSLSGSSGSGSRGSSRISGRTSRSSKNKRKLERKMMSLKEGSPYEDLALMRALHQLLSSTFGLSDEVRSLCCVLVKFERDSEASNLQSLFSDLLELMERAKSEIWPPDLLNARVGAGTESYGPDATSNLLAARMQVGGLTDNGLSLLEPHLRMPPQVTSTPNWKLKILQPT